jgi:uncharacterized membrane protein
MATGQGATVGVATGVATGVAGGVTGGTPGGVPGGVESGVRGGVAGGGVAGGVVVEQDTQAARERQRRAAVDEFAKLQRELAAVAAQMKGREAEIEQQRAKLEMQLAQASAGLDMAALQAQIEVAQRAAERTRRLVETGLATASTLSEQEARLVQLQQALQRTELGHERTVEEFQLRVREAEQRQEFEKRMLAIQAELAIVGQQSGMRADIQAQAEAVARQVEQLIAQAEAARGVAAGSRGADELLMAQTTTVTDAGARVQERDVLVVEISGETLLPRAYQVATDGSIRLPLLGEVQVRGLTSREVRDLVSTRLADRRLAEGAAITVTIRRPAGRQGGR